MTDNNGGSAISLGPFIDGHKVDAHGDAKVDVRNPSTGAVCATIPKGSAADIDAAVAAARLAFEGPSWSQAAPSVRKTALHRWSDLILTHAEELDRLDAVEMGKPISLRVFDAAGAAALVRYNAEAVDKILGEVFTSDATSFVCHRHVPRGVVGAISPWNFPAFNAVLKTAPALAAGNAVVLKPSELSSQSALRIAELAIEAGIPSGILNVVPGLGETVGAALALHRGVDLLTFTGSTATGKRMLGYSGQSNMKAIIAECGGKSPQIVFDDGVDLDAAALSIAQLLLVNQGQLCSTGSRLLVQRSIQQHLLDSIARAFGQISMGIATDPASDFGPLASAAQLDRVMGYIEGARRAGVTIVTGGSQALASSGGYFVEPTLFADVSPELPIACEEIFGPVLSVIPFDTLDDAVQIANATPYGLAAYVWTASIQTGMAMARGIRSSVLINAVAPMGEGGGHAAGNEPYGESGLGAEGGLAGLKAFTRRQMIWLNHG